MRVVIALGGNAMTSPDGSARLHDVERTGISVVDRRDTERRPVDNSG